MKGRIAVVLACTGALAMPAVAAAEPVKSCPTDGPGKANFTQEQKASCASQGQGGSQTSQGISNPGGNQPPGQQ